MTPTGGRWEQVGGYAAARDRAEWQDDKGRQVVEFSVGCTREGMTIWYRAVCRGDVAALAQAEVEKGTSVMIAGKVEDRGQNDYRTGKWVKRLVMQVGRLVLKDSFAEAVDESGPVRIPAGATEEDQAKNRQANILEYPPRWLRRGWAETPGGAEFFAQNPDAYFEAEAQKNGSPVEPDPTPVTQEEIHEFVGRFMEAS